jgi:hypothetical protein
VCDIDKAVDVQHFFTPQADAVDTVSALTCHFAFEAMLGVRGGGGGGGGGHKNIPSSLDMSYPAYFTSHQFTKKSAIGAYLWRNRSSPGSIYL